MKMKFISIILAVVILSGCEDFLDKKPLGQMTQEDLDNLATNGSGNTALLNEMDKLLLGAYAVYGFDESQIEGVSHHGEFLWDIITDDCEKGGDGAADYSVMLNWRLWNTLPSGGPQNAAYVTGYAGVVRANDVMKQVIEKKDAIGDTLQYNRLMGEALFIRGWYYFYLTKLFGSVPYIGLEDLKEGEKYAQPTPAEMYSLIEKDFQDAVRLLPTKNQLKLNFGIKPAGRATKGAAEMALARVISMEIGFGYNNKTWKEIYDLTTDVIKSNQYGLVNNYAQVFTLEAEQGPEGIFEIDAADTKQGHGGPHTNIQPTLCGPRLTVSKQNAGKHLFSGWGFQLPSKNLYEEFEAGDPRRANTIVQSGDILLEDGNPATDEMIIIDPGSAQCPTGYFNRKVIIKPDVPPSCNACTDINKRLIRFSEALLLAAEAAYQLGFEAEAREYVNRIRERARNSSGPKGSQLGNPDYPARNVDASVLPAVTASGAELLKAIKHERRVELALEGHRLWDLYRWGDYEKAIETYAPADILLTESAATIIASFKTHLIDNKVPVLPIPRNEVLNYGVNPSPGYVY